MKIEKWKFKGEEIDVPILDKDEVEVNVDMNDLEDTVDLTQILKENEEHHE